MYIFFFILRQFVLAYYFFGNRLVLMYDGKVVDTSIPYFDLVYKV
jgi:hypothetical protein